MYCVAYAHNGKRFASGGADNTVIIWTSKVGTTTRVRAAGAPGTAPAALSPGGAALAGRRTGKRPVLLQPHQRTCWVAGRNALSPPAAVTECTNSPQAEGILKYTHNESIQVLAYNPVTQQLASATSSDLGLWSPEQKSVAKHKVRNTRPHLNWQQSSRNGHGTPPGTHAPWLQRASVPGYGMTNRVRVARRGAGALAHLLAVVDQRRQPAGRGLL